MYFCLFSSYSLCFMSADAMLFEAFCNVSSSWIAFFFFFFFSFLKIFWFSSLFTARQKLDHKTEAKFESLSLGPFGGCRLPRLPSGESTLKCFSFAFLLIWRHIWTTCVCLVAPPPQKKKMLNNYFFWKTPGYSSQNVYTAGVWF